MTPQELAKYLHGRPYGREVPQQLEQHATYEGLVIVFGVDDHLVRFRGAIDDEAGAPGIVLIDTHGVLRDREARARAKTAPCIEALWCEEEPYSFTYRTSIPHASFDILEPAGKYCRGIVFRLSDLAKGAA